MSTANDNAERVTPEYMLAFAAASAGVNAHVQLAQKGLANRKSLETLAELLDIAARSYADSPLMHEQIMGLRQILDIAFTYQDHPDKR